MPYDNKISPKSRDSTSIPKAENKSVKQMGTSPFAMDNRDPNNLNPHLQVQWDDVFGEPDGLKTPETCWNCSRTCYNGTRNCCYILLAVLLSPFIAFINGLSFACIAFNHVWCVGPCLRMWKMNCSTFRKFWMGCLLAVCGPCSEVFGLYFSKVKVRYQKLPDGIDMDINLADEYFTV